MGCKALFIGGIKSGKSKNAEKYTIANSTSKPIYLATNEFFDDEMKERVNLHQKQRADDFTTLEEPLRLSKFITDQTSSVLVECVSMWINNMLHHGYSEKDMFEELDNVANRSVETIWVINDVSCSVVSDNALVRKFVDINGRISQHLAQMCEEVYKVTAGISVQIK